MIYILLPVYNRKVITQQFVHCLKEQTYENWHLIVIDDGSTDGTSEMIRVEIPSATIIRGNGKLWWAGSLQKGIDWLKTNTLLDDLILMINDDVILQNNFLASGIDVMKNNFKTILLALNYSNDNKIIDNGRYVDWKKFTFNKSNDPWRLNCFSTRGLLMRYEDLLAVGGFYPLILPHYGSDYEFTNRALKRGLKIISDNSFFLFGNEDTSGTRNEVKTYKNISEYFKALFNKKDLRNIQIWLGLIILACPWKYKCQNILRVLKNAFSGAVKCLLKTS